MMSILEQWTALKSRGPYWGLWLHSFRQRYSMSSLASGWSNRHRVRVVLRLREG
jgi:hypothetical protein